jgi:hypothetical protein
MALVSTLFWSDTRSAGWMIAVARRVDRHLEVRDQVGLRGVGVIAVAV